MMKILVNVKVNSYFCSDNNHKEKKPNYKRLNEIYTNANGNYRC